MYIIKKHKKFALLVAVILLLQLCIAIPFANEKGLLAEESLNTETNPVTLPIIATGTTATVTPVFATQATATITIPGSGNGNGLKGEYYDDRNFNQLILSRTDSEVNFNWGGGSPDPLIKKTTYSVRWSGKLLAEHTGEHTIFTNTSDGVRLWINGQLKIDDWKGNSLRENSTKVDFVAGQKYDIVMEYYSNSIDARATLLWENTYHGKSVIPQSQLYSKPKYPAKINAVSVGPKNTLTWSNTAGAESYEIEVDGSLINVGMNTVYEHIGLLPNTQHLYRVRTVNEVSPSEWSEYIHKTSAPGTPTKLSGISDVTSVSITWDAVELAAGYDIEVNGSTIDNGASTSYIHKGLQPGTQCIYRVRAKNEHGVSDWSEMLSKTTLPATPVNINTELTSSSIKLKWDAAAGAINYEIEADGKIIKDIGATEYLFNGFAPNSEHSFRVRARSVEGAGYWSEYINKRTLLETPVNIVAKVTDKTISLSWSEVSDATGYEIQADGLSLKVGNITTYTHEGLLPNSTHRYMIRAINDVNISNWSPNLEKTTLPDVPKNVASSVTSHTITLSWDKVAGAIGYDIEIDGRLIDAGNISSYTHENLQSKTKHSYRVRTKSISGVGYFTELVSATTLIAEPANISVLPDITSIKLTWSPVVGAAGYDIEADGKIIKDINAVEYTFEGLAPNTSHSYKVRAKDAAGAGDWRAVTTKTLLETPEITGIETTDKTATISWTSIIGATSYEIDLDSVQKVVVSGNSYEHSGLMPNSKHSYKVRALTVDNTSKWSGMAEKFTLPDIPRNISNKSSSYAIDLTWSTVPGAINYDIEVDGVLFEGLTSTSYLHENLESNTAHTYKLRAKSDHGTGYWSEILTKHTAPGVPVNINGTSTSTSITLNWDPVDFATAYDVEVQGSPVDAGNITSYTHTGLNPNIQRIYRVRAKNEHGLGDWSVIVAKSTLPSAIKDINAVPKETSIILNWEAVAGSKGYEAEINGAVIKGILSNEYEFKGLTPNTEYSLRVRPITPSGEIDWSEHVKVYTLPQVPEGITAISSDDKIVIKWNALVRITGYDIEVDGKLIDNGLSNQFEHQGLSSSTKHTYRVRAKNESNVGNWSALIAKFTLPDAPQNLNGTSTGSKLTVTWDAVNGATGYEIEADGVLFNCGYDVTFIHEGQTSNTVHKYKVRAKNEEGFGKWSEELTLSTLVGVPKNLKTARSSTLITVSWDPMEGVTGYEVEADGIIINAGTNPSLQHKDLVPNTTHIYRVRAMVGEQPGEWSSPVTAVTLLATVNEIEATSTDNSITINWASVGDAEVYDVELNGEITADLIGTTHTFEKLAPNTEYTIRVKARNDNNTSAWSEPIIKFTTTKIPGNIKANATTTSIEITWDAVEGAADYDIEVDGKVINVGANTRYKHEGLSSNTMHKYKVRVKNEQAVSDWSELITVNTTPELQIEVAKDNSFNFVIMAPKNPESASRTIVALYNAEELEAVDFCAATSKLDNTVGVINGTNLQVLEYTPGRIVFKLIDPTQGIMNSIVFRSKTNGTSKITYSIEK